VAYLSNISRHCDVGVKITIFTRALLRRLNVLNVILGTINTNAVIPPKIYKIKIRIIYIVPLVYF